MKKKGEKGKKLVEKGNHQGRIRLTKGWMRRRKGRRVRQSGELSHFLQREAWRQLAGPRLISRTRRKRKRIRTRRIVCERIRGIYFVFHFLVFSYLPFISFLFCVAFFLISLIPQVFFLLRFTFSFPSFNALLLFFFFPLNHCHAFLLYNESLPLLFLLSFLYTSFLIFFYSIACHFLSVYSNKSPLFYFTHFPEKNQSIPSLPSLTSHSFTIHCHLLPTPKPQNSHSYTHTHTQ